MTADSSLCARRRAVALTACAALLLVAACRKTTGGSGSPATASDSSSPTASRATTNHGLVPYKGDRFTVSMPGTPVKKVLHEQGTVGDFTITFLTVETGNNTFNVAYSDYPRVRSSI